MIFWAPGHDSKLMVSSVCGRHSDETCCKASVAGKDPAQLLHCMFLILSHGFDNTRGEDGTASLKQDSQPIGVPRTAMHNPSRKFVLLIPYPSFLVAQVWPKGSIAMRLGILTIGFGISLRYLEAHGT